MNIVVKKLDSTKETIEVEPTDPVHKVLNVVAESTGISPDQIRFLYKGKSLAADKSFEDQNVANNAAITMIVSLRGGCSF